jgi:hypothetical protein
LSYGETFWVESLNRGQRHFEQFKCQPTGNNKQIINQLPDQDFPAAGHLTVRTGMVAAHNRHVDAIVPAVPFPIYTAFIFAE